MLTALLCATSFFALSNHTCEYKIQVARLFESIPCCESLPSGLMAIGVDNSFVIMTRDSYKTKQEAYNALSKWKNHFDDAFVKKILIFDSKPSEASKPSKEETKEDTSSKEGDEKEDKSSSDIIGLASRFEHKFKPKFDNPDKDKLNWL